MKISGKIYKIMETVQVSDTFRKRDLVLEYAENPLYPQFISLQMVQDKCEILNAYSEGQIVDIDFNLKGREWTSPAGEVRYFNTLDAWRIGLAQPQQPGLEMVNTTHQELTQPQADDLPPLSLENKPPPF